MTTLRLLSFCLLALANPLVAEPIQGVNDVVYDEDVVIFRSVELEYPRGAASAHVQGIVVVKVTMDDAGEILSAAALSGPKLLIDASVANARRWALKPTRSKAAILVYNFRIEDAICKSASSFYVLRPPNVSVITACHEPLNP